MVSFSCEVCNDTIVKKKLDQHTQRCRGAYFTCIDCNKTFSGTDYRNHTSCISEDEKYQKSLYKGKKKNGNNNNNDNNNGKNANKDKESKSPSASTETVNVSPKKEKNSTVKDTASKITKHIKKDGMSLYKLLKKLDKNQKNDFLKQISVSRDESGQIQIAKYL